MALPSLRHKQTSCIIRMLNLNQQSTNGSKHKSVVFKVLILDKFCLDILSTLFHVQDLRNHGVTLHWLIDDDRDMVADVPAVYFVQPNPFNIQRVVHNVSHSVCQSFCLNFSSSIPRPLLEDLASGTLQSGSVGRISQVFDQHLGFVTLEDDMFSLAQPNCYVELNDPTARDHEIEEVIEKVVSGLFSVLATLSVVPIISCPRGGPAEMVAASLNTRLRDHLIFKQNLFSGEGFGSSFQRPILCIFDRNFDLSVGVQHDFRYRPLVHDVLGLKLNALVAGPHKYEFNAEDPFWIANASLEFPEIAVEIETQLNKINKEIEEVNKGTGGEVFDVTDLTGNTRHLMNTVNALPQLIKSKQVIDKHTNTATLLLNEIKERSLDSYARKENFMLNGGGIDKNELLSLLSGKGTKMDKLRLALTYLLSSESIPQSEVEAVEAALIDSNVDTCAFLYVKKMKSLNISLASATSAGKSNILDWAERLYGQSISAVTAGMKNLLSGQRKLALTETVKALMEGTPNPETESYLVFDPRSPKSISESGRGHLKGPFKEAIVFMVGGGNYVEYEGLQELVKGRQPGKHIIYGATEVLTGGQFVEQLTLLGQKMGLGSSNAASTH